MKYYVAVNGQQTGPFEENLLLSQGVTPDTLVWAEGMTEWKPAKEALPHLFPAAQPYQYNAGGQVPPQPYQYSAEPVPPQPKTWLAESIIITLFCCLVFGIIGIIKSASVSTLYAQKRYAEAEEASKSAAKWVRWGFICGIIGIILYAILTVAGLGTSIYNL